jgi:hypothetical protein
MAMAEQEKRQSEKEKRQPKEENRQSAPEPESESSSVDTAADDAGAELEKLQGGSKLSVGESDVPVPALVAIGIFVVAFMIVWMLLWAVLGGLGLGFGWIVAAAAGAGAVKLYADRRGADPGAGSRR